jgi:intracellular sulfur oxidation DsrE/DsrF family protein
MLFSFSRFMSVLIAAALMGTAVASDKPPWGTAQVQSIDYAPQKVVYDVAARDVDTFSRVLDRVSYLNNLYHADPFGASIVLVLHGDEISFFAISDFDKYKDLVTRAQSLTVGGTIDIRMCEVAARGHGLAPADIHGFVKLVPMADAELVRLQQEEGYVYMQ